MISRSLSSQHFAAHLPEGRTSRELALVELYRNDRSAREYVAAEFMPLVRGLARRYKRGEEPLEDLVQVASLGLMKALHGFDIERGGSFAAYAIPTITGELRRHYRDKGWAVHVPRALQELAQRVSAEVRRMETDLGRTPTAGEIAATLGLTDEDIVEARNVAGAMRAGSLDRPTTDDDEGSSSLMDRLPSQERGFEAVEHRATIGELTKTLSDRDRTILVMRYGQSKSQREIGDQIGVSQMHVSRLLQRAEAELRLVASGASSSAESASADGPED